MSPLALALALLAEPPALLAVQAETLEARPALTLVLSAPLGEVDMRREGDGLALSLQATAPRDLKLPPAPAPAEALSLQSAGGRLTLRLRLAPEVAYTLRRRGSLVSVLLGEAPGAVQPPADVRELYQRILPPPAAQTEPPGALREAEPAEGLALGTVTVHPAVDLTYVDAESALLDTPRPVRERYWELRPNLRADMPLGTGQLRGAYEARIRRGSDLEVLRATTHVADLEAELPLGSHFSLRGSEHFARGTLETREVDPGREYFFRLARFTHNIVSAGARFDTGRTELAVDGRLRKVDIDDPGAFFDHEVRTLSAGLRYELTSVLQAALGYGYERVPPPFERPLAESTTHSVTASLQGEVLPLVTGWLGLGYRDHRSPRAPAGGQRFRGLWLGSRLTKEFGPASSLTLAASRTTELSAFERNAFYVANEVSAAADLTLPFSIVFRGGAGYHRNDYRTVASELGAPREDAIWSWSVGLGRPLTRWAYVRADYRREDRDSNIDRFDTESRAFTAQVGIGLYREVRP